MDGVLLDSEPVYEKVEGALLRELGGPSADFVSILPQLLGRTSRDSARIALDAFDIDMPIDDFLELRNARLVPAMRDVAIMPGVERFVADMRARGVRMSIATSSPKVLLDAKKVGKDDFFANFEGIVCGDDVKKGKPDPEIFMAAAKLIDAPADACLVFEDAPAGIRGAKAAGMACVAIPNADVEYKLYEDAGPDFVMSSFEVAQPEVYGLPTKT